MRRSGFTLVEVMVVLAVTAMLSAVILVYNASTRETLRLFTEKARMAQVIMRAKSLALSTYADEGGIPCGYGVQIDRANNTYRMVGYRPRSCSDRAQIEISSDAFTDVPQSTFPLPATLAFASTDPLEDLSYVLFIPPDPMILLGREDGSLIAGGNGTIRMQVKDSATDAIIKVNAAGQVTF